MHTYWPIKRIPINLNVGLAALIITLNGFAWVGVLLAAPEPYVVDPVRDPEIVTLLEYIRTGDQSEETWQVTLTELEAEQTITWYLQRYPQIPFAHPQVEITPDYVAGEGDAMLAGLRVHVGGKARITLAEGLPQVEILELNLPVPGPIRHAIEDEIEVQLRRADLLPVRFSTAEWGEGEVVVRGVIR
ncbi:MAG: hypothetical protein KDJ65_04835 [Anaerolineae bacterium]|nr:hypothetical protein [Anaerolineae bacterium]